MLGKEDHTPNQETGDDPCVVLCTGTAVDAERISAAVIRESHAACVNIVPVTSCFIWEETVTRDEESLLIIKTSRDRVDGLTSRICSLHSYDLPEVIVLPIVGGLPEYLDWVRGVGR
ncbi:MAG: divalent-cation tolerance protein CutA [Methanomicrobiales archaeon]